MRVDASQVLGQGGVKIRSGTGSATDSLKEGDVIRAKVLSSDKSGTLTLKTENGQSFKAKLDTDVKLHAGDTILLEVSGKEKGLISLSFSGVEETLEEPTGGQASLVRDFTDKSLAPFASKLAELSMPVTEETARLMRELIAQNPGMSLDEAAFLASNKLTGDESLMRAALAIISNGDKTDAMIARLTALLGEQDHSVDQEPGVRNPEHGVKEAVQTATSSNETASAQFTVSPANSAPLTDLLTLIVRSAASLSGTSGQVDSPPQTTAQTIIPQSDSIMQSTNVENVEEIFYNGEKNTQQPLSHVQNSSVQNPEHGESGAEGRVTQSTGQPENAPLQSPSADPPAAQTAGQPAAAGASSPADPGSSPPQPVGSVVAQLLSEIPEFSGTPASALEKFSNMLMRVAGDNKETLDDNTAKLVSQLDKLFTRIERNDTDAGARLKEAREELYARLALLEETISNATQPARTEMLGQTQKLMEHVRLLNSIDQFVYMQLPVQLSEERKSAELYIFKRKGKKSADPENVNILLALDLEYMGHWEALLNIKNKDVYIQMEVPGAAEKEHFLRNTVLLHEMLDEAGFKLVNTEIKYSEKETTPLTALSSLSRYTNGRPGMIDFMI